MSIQERCFRGFFVLLLNVFRVAVAVNNAPQHHLPLLCIKKNTETENPRKQRSCIDVTGPLSLVSRLARFCTQPEVKFYVFDRLKQGEEKSTANLFFRFSYENNKKIRSSKYKKSVIYTLRLLEISLAFNPSIPGLLGKEDILS